MSASDPGHRGTSDALRNALADVIAAERREWRREREAIQSEMQAAVAEMRANIAEERAIGAVVDGKPSTKRTLRAFTDAAADAVARAIAGMQREGKIEQERRDAEFGALRADMATSAAWAKEGRTFNVRGTWAKVATYRALDVVALNGGSFVARRDNPGPCPGDGWQLLAAQGKRGARAPAVVGLSVTEEGLLTVRNGDGSHVKLDLYPLLSKIAHARAGA